MRRLCLECLACPTSWNDEFFCPACQVEHDMRNRPLYGKYPEPGDWSFQGITIEQVDVDAGDLDGFYVASLTHGDSAYENDTAYA